MSIENILKPSTVDHINLAFNKKYADKRKNWLKQYDKDSILEYDDSMTVTYPNFVNKDLKHFSNYDNLRSIPSVMDGWKPSHRKIMYACFKRGYNKGETKVAQLAGYVAEHTEYHHNEDALKGTIIGLAQNFVGSNNINFLSPIGNFGYRNLGGKDAASPRYIFTELEKITAKIFREEDEMILNYINEDGHMIEPDYYVPIIPTVLVNGTQGIGTGFSTNIPPYNPKDIIANLKRLIKGKDMEPMIPWYKGFKGTIERDIVKGQESDTRFISSGIMEILDSQTVKITEIPIDMTISAYDTFLKLKMMTKKEKDKETGKGKGSKGSKGDEGKVEKLPEIESIKSRSGNNYVEFEVKFRDLELKKLMKLGRDHLVNFLKLTSKISITNLHLYDSSGKIVKYDSPEDILEYFYVERLNIYKKRINYMVCKLKNLLDIIHYKVKYIKDVNDDTIIVKGKDTNQLLERIAELKYPKLSTDHLDPDDKKSYSYLTSLYITSLTKDKIKELENERDKRKSEYEDYLNTSAENRWLKEIKELEVDYEKWYESNKNIEEAEVKVVGKTKKENKGEKNIVKVKIIKNKA